MAIQDIRNYLEANRGKYPPELLVAELRKAGHAESEIQEALRSLNISGIALAPGQVIITTWGKVWRFALGFLAGSAVSSLVTLAFYLLFSSIERFVYSYAYRSGLALWISAAGAVLVSAGISLLLYFKLRRNLPYFARGVLTGALLTSAALVAFVVFLSLIFWNFGS